MRRRMLLGKKNLFQVIDISSWSLTDGIYSNAVSDTRSYFDFYLQIRYTDYTYNQLVLIPIYSAGHYAYNFTFVANKSIDFFRFLHNGATRNISMFISPMGFENGKRYRISFDVLSANPLVVGGIQVKDIVIEEL